MAGECESNDMAGNNLNSKDMAGERVSQKIAGERIAKGPHGRSSGRRGRRIWYSHTPTTSDDDDDDDDAIE